MCICYIQNTATEWHVRSVCRTGNECDESNIAEGHELGLRYSDASDDRKKSGEGSKLANVLFTVLAGTHPATFRA